jgi:hypothetical protein
MIQKVTLAIIILTLFLGVGCKTQDLTAETPEYTYNTELNHAKPYLVLGEGNIANEEEGRTVGLWFIVSQEATGYEEYAETTIQAVRDLYSLYKRDFTSIQLIPSAELEYALCYAHAFYAADGKGALGMTGSATAKEMYWRVQATDQPLTEQELAIAELWWEKIPDFPSQDPLSSLSYDEAALRQYVADTLNIPVSEVIFPQVSYSDYEYEEKL